MKKLLLLLIVCGFIQQGIAQTTGGPDAYGYIWRDSNDPNGPMYTWNDIKGLPGTVSINGLTDDNFVGPFVLPAPFPYYWYTTSKFWIGSNGYMSFDPFLIASPFPAIPISGASLNNYIGAFVSDLNFAGAANPGRCYYWHSATNDTVVVQYDSVGFWMNAVPDYDGNNTFQIMLNYNDSTITFYYKDQIGFGTNNGTNYHTVGIENNSGTIGLQWGHDQIPPQQYAIRFYPPANSTLVINDASTLYNNNVDNAGLFLSRFGATFPLNSVVKNVGNSTLSGFNVESKVQAANNTVPVTNSTAVGSLNAGDVANVNPINPFNPSTAGVFRFTTTTQLVGDATPSNNARVLELNVVDTSLTNIELSYDNGTNSGNGISWSGGNGGCANLFIPPFYPCYITSVKAFIVDDPNGFGYVMKVYDNSGPNGVRGNLLDSMFVMPGSFTINGYVTTPCNAPIQIDSGGFYVEWDMVGEGVALGQNTVAPISNRTYEVLAGSLSDYRSREIEDLMLRAVITKTVVGIEENNNLKGIGEVYPNPANDFVSITIDPTEIKNTQLTVSIFDIQGKVVSSSLESVLGNKLNLSTRNLNAGIYTIKISNNELECTKKLTIIK